MTSTPGYDLDALVALLAAATPGEWSEYALNSILRYARKNGGYWDDLKEDFPDDTGIYPDDSDAKFIVEVKHALPAMIADLREYAKFVDRVQRGLNGPYPGHGLDDIATHAEKAGEALQAIGKATGSDWDGYKELPGIVSQMRADNAAALEMLRRLEWCPYLDGTRGCCPVCECDKNDGHAATCELDALLKKMGG